MWTGIGYGAFEQAFQPYRGEDVPHLRFLLENTYLETVFELGVPAALLWFGMLGALLIQCLRGVMQRVRDRVYPTIAVASAAVAGFHSMFDMSLQIPAVAMTFSAILGVGVAQSWPSGRQPEQREPVDS